MYITSGSETQAYRTPISKQRIFVDLKFENVYLTNIHYAIILRIIWRGKKMSNFHKHNLHKVLPQNKNCNFQIQLQASHIYMQMLTIYKILIALYNSLD